MERLRTRDTLSAQDYGLLRFSLQAQEALMEATLGESDSVSESTVADVLETTKATLRAEGGAAAEKTAGHAEEAAHEAETRAAEAETRAAAAEQRATDWAGRAEQSAAYLTDFDRRVRDRERRRAKAWASWLSWLLFGLPSLAAGILAGVSILLALLAPQSDRFLPWWLTATLLCAAVAWLVFDRIATSSGVSVLAIRRRLQGWLQARLERRFLSDLPQASVGALQDREA